MLFWAGALLVLALDQVTKFLVHLTMSPNRSFGLITYVQNRGAAFGLFQGTQVFLVIAGLLVILLVYYFHLKFKSGDLLQIPLGMILGGSLGNLLDRVFRHYVVDFIDFRFWPVFNIADTCLNIGVGWLILILLFKKER